MADCYALRLKLDITPHQVALLDKRYFLMWRIHNILIRQAQKMIRILERDDRYTCLRKQYGAAKNRKEPDEVLESIEEQMNAVRAELGITKSDLERYAKVQQHKYRHIFSSQQVQKEADRVWASVRSYLFKNGKQIRFKKYRDFDSISQKSAENGIKFRGDHILWNGGRFPLIIPNTEYVRESLKHPLCYTELKRIEFNNGYHYYAVLILKGKPPMNYGRGSGRVGIDLGTSTVAAVGPSCCMLEELAPESQKYSRKIRHLQKRIERSMRNSDPQNYNEDGTIRKGRHSWHLTKNCRRMKREVRVLYRKRTDYTRCHHHEQLNRILQNASIIIVEPMNFQALQKRAKNTERSEKESVIRKKDGREQKIHKFKRKKRFGKSINNRSPGRFAADLKQMCRKYRIRFYEVETMKYRASQLDHTTGEYIKCPIDTRFKTIDGHAVQRDLYSAFLISNADIRQEEITEPNYRLCEKKFEDFADMQDDCIAEMKKAGISRRACFGF